MNKEHYLTAVSTAIETCETQMGDAYERLASSLRRDTARSVVEIQVMQMHLEARIASAMIALHDTLASLRKWPIE